MYYEPNPKRKKRARRAPDVQPKRAKRARRGGCLGPLIKLAFTLVVALALFMLASGLIVSNNFFSGARPDLATNAGLPGGYTHVLLLGADAGEDGEPRGRSDSILIASFGDGGDIKLTSVMRDTMLDMGAQGEHKANAAYKIGGGELAMYTINKAFGLDITKYAAIDFPGIARVIDAMGGIELTITEDEMNQINQGLRSAYKKKRVFNGVLMTPLTQYGKHIHMSGTHAMFYARIRYIDSDFKRAERHRILLSTMLAKLKANPLSAPGVGLAALSSVQTNLNPLDLAALGARAMAMSGGMQQFRVPPDSAAREVSEGGIWMIRPDLKKCRQMLYEFLYGKV